MAEENTQIRRPTLRDYSPTEPNPLSIDIGQSFINQGSVDPVVEEQSFAYSQSHGGGNSSESKKYPPFYPYLKRNGTGYDIAVKTGYVVEHVIAGDSSIKYHLPTGVPTRNNADPIWKAIEIGQCLYIKCDINEDGEIEGNPALIVGDSGLEGEHYRPEVFDFGGNSGISYYKLCQLVSDGPGVSIKLFNAGSNVEHYDERVGMENLELPQDIDAGSIYRIGKNYDETSDKVQFRTLMQLEGDGEPVIKDEEAATPLDSIRFRRIVDLGSEAQVHVSNQDGAILVRGNSYPSSVTNAHKISMTVKDGLVTDLQQIDSEGWWGTIGFGFLASESYVTAALVFEDGMLKTVEVNATNIEGTEGTPGVANINFSV